MKQKAISYLFKAVLIIVFLPLPVSSQMPVTYDKSLLETELAKKNIDLEEFEDRLSAEGIDIVLFESRSPNAFERKKIEDIINE